MQNPRKIPEKCTAGNHNNRYDRVDKKNAVVEKTGKNQKFLYLCGWNNGKQN